MTHPLAGKGLSRAFDEEPAADSIDLTVEYGEIHAVVGLNGAGKTTLMRLLVGMLHPDAGTAKVLGYEATHAPPATWTKVGHLIETPFLYPELTVVENLEIAALLHGMDRRGVSSAVAQAVSRFGLDHWAHRRTRTLSLGNRQRLGLASALVHQPNILLLDEPANALDPAGVVFVRDLMGSLAADGVAVLVSSHHLDEIARIAHRITVLHRGRIIGSLDPGEVDLERRFFDLVYDTDARAGRT